MKFFHDLLDLICTAIVVIGFVILGPLAVATLTGNRSVCAVTFGYFFAFLAASAWIGRDIDYEMNKPSWFCWNCMFQNIHTQNCHRCGAPYPNANH